MEKQLSLRGKLIAFFETWFIDHEILRKLYRNFHRLSADAYRSNHPSAGFLKKVQKKYGVKTIVSMRRADTKGPYLFEKAACDKLGLILVNHVMSSRRLPEVEEIIKAKEILETAEYPILIHCKSGADRAGLMSVFYKHFILKQPIQKAVSELSMKYGHFRWANTGKLDYFFDAFMAYEKQHPGTTFMEWVTQHYDKPALNQKFVSAGWANIVVDKLLKRE
ncbi:protein-tyrosine-phosphatase [Hydrogenovibrio sp. SC-1]|uniref:fused DSP-PTPase phosphatase/NAD kinase-like protein n=1 Tax=Hydrogenovibrio sp. SC-1 TaxID=2065820 RepID=UPI000C7C0B45|nr:protein-tyrosine-phosphatase [Hydrogenovibrio sp. SC-1]PLA75192.1 protein-tyrosine-phosphatase [Hydrogenovibrio sp. SC-1]